MWLTYIVQVVLIFFFKLRVLELFPHDGQNYLNIGGPTRLETASFFKFEQSGNSHHHHYVVVLAGISLTLSLSLSISVIHRFRSVFQSTSCVRTELWLINSSRSSYTCASVWKAPKENVAYVFVLALLAVSRMSRSSDLVVFKMGGRSPSRCCFVECCFRDLFNITRSILAQLQSSFSTLYA